MKAFAIMERASRIVLRPRDLDRRHRPTPRV
jgi:hypothetical protein